MNKVSGETVRAIGWERSESSRETLARIWCRSQRQEGLLRSNTARRERLRIDRDDFDWKCSNNRALSHQRDRHVVVLTSFYSNGYGAPAPEVLTTLVAYHAVVLRRSFRGPRAGESEADGSANTFPSKKRRWLDGEGSKRRRRRKEREAERSEAKRDAEKRSGRRRRARHVAKTTLELAG
ncbi:hypothetical protein GW17_00023133 [Ensete ventricosum]|nr:hypothetical protein GW17_00023133 [Ensete ventricosum]